MDGLGYTTIIEPAEPLARRRGSALDRSAYTESRAGLIGSGGGRELIVADGSERIGKR
jgi:hypothetical protein